MFRWLLPVLLACSTSVFAAPEAAVAPVAAPSSVPALAVGGETMAQTADLAADLVSANASTSAAAIPASAPAAAPAPAAWTASVRSQLVELGQSVAAPAHEVADHTGDLVATAMGFLGVPYRRGGSSAQTGFDCSGFVRSIYEQTRGLVLPRKASDQAARTEKIDKYDLRPGDLVFFNTMRRAFSHVGIYIGDGKFIHSPRSGQRVRVEDMSQSYWKTRFNGARRVVDDAASLADAVRLAPAPR